jgi:hypothetical protein
MSIGARPNTEAWSCSCRKHAKVRADRTPAAKAAYPLDFRQSSVMMIQTSSAWRTETLASAASAAAQARSPRCDGPSDVDSQRLFVRGVRAGVGTGFADSFRC